MDEYLRNYYENNAKKLHMLVDKILMQFCTISEKDRDDFYSLANEVFTEVMKRYDSKQSFEGFLYSCLSNKIKTEMTRRNAEKRKIELLSVSLDLPIDGKEEVTLGDLLADRFDMDKAIFGEDDEMTEKLKRYLKRLSVKQRKIIALLLDSYKAGEIQKRLHMTKREYMDAMRGIRAYENISILF